MFNGNGERQQQKVHGDLLQTFKDKASIIKDQRGDLGDLIKEAERQVLGVFDKSGDGCAGGLFNCRAILRFLMGKVI